MTWGFYGRRTELAAIKRILDRRRFFFCAISGRRRVGKTSLIQEALKRHAGPIPGFYMQTPDGDKQGVIQVFNEALEDMAVEAPLTTPTKSYPSLAERLGELWQNGTVTIIDEFQYFHRKALAEFTSHLQRRVDEARRDNPRGGLFTLGSIHTEMTAILDDKNSPLFNRVTDTVTVGHWDTETLFEMFHAHGIEDAMQQLFLWTLFEGVPKFYRDCYDQGILIPSADHRKNTLQRMFFEGSSPLRDEADNWFLRELRGRYDSVLGLLARTGPVGHGDLLAEFKKEGGDEGKQLGGYLKTLIDKYQIVEKQDPILAPDKSRRGRYIIADNFLNSWLSGIKRHVQASKLRPMTECVEKSSIALQTIEGFAFEKLVRQTLMELSRKGLGDFMLSDIVKGYWDKADGGPVEIDIIAISEENRTIRFGSCKRNSEKHGAAEREKFKNHVARFLKQNASRIYAGWKTEFALYAPAFSADHRRLLQREGYICHDMAYFDTCFLQNI